MTEEKHFYNKFVDEDKLSKIDDIKIQRSFFVYFYSISLFCISSVIFPTFVGYNFVNAFAISIFCFFLFIYFWLIYFSVKFILLNKKYSVFRKKKYAPLFCMGFILLNLVFIILPIFTTEFTSYADSSFEVILNPAFFFFIFLPLYFGYFMFCYYAFYKCFAKYAKSRVSNKDNIV